MEYGLVMCGGGGRGAYQIGAWKALEKLGLTQSITAVSGTSVGALNAALYATVSVAEAARIWENISTADIANPADAVTSVAGRVLDFIDAEDKWRYLGGEIKPFLMSGLFTRSGLVSIIKDNGINTAVTHAEIPCFACCTNVTENRAEYFDLHRHTPQEVTQILTASSAIQGVFPVERMNGCSYLDGGNMDNIPVRPLYNLGYRNFIVLYLDEKPLNKRAFPDAEFVEIVPSDEIYLGNKNTSILSNGTLDFRAESAAARIDLGEKETAAELIILKYSGQKLLT